MPISGVGLKWPREGVIPPLLFSVVHPPLFLLRSGALVLHPRSAAILRSKLPTGHAHTLDPAARRFPPRLQNPFPATLPCSRSLQTRTARLKKLKPPKRTPGGQPGLWKPEAGSRESSSGNLASKLGDRKWNCRTRNRAYRSTQKHPDDNRTLDRGSQGSLFADRLTRRWRSRRV